MAHKEYPVDEFDRLASDRKVRGAHRRPESNRKWWIALVVILVGAPLLGWALVNWAGHTPDSTAGKGSESTAIVTDSPTVASTPTATAEPTDMQTTETAEPQETEEPLAEADLSTPIQVRNASLIAGHAAAMQQELYDAGYTNVGADNYPDTSPEVSQVYYPDASYEATALAVAEVLGIPADADHVIEGGGTEGTGVIVVVLAGDLG